eukprot:gene4676-14876_t
MSSGGGLGQEGGGLDMPLCSATRRRRRAGECVVSGGAVGGALPNGSARRKQRLSAGQMAEDIGVVGGGPSLGGRQKGGLGHLCGGPGAHPMPQYSYGHLQAPQDPSSARPGETLYVGTNTLADFNMDGVMECRVAVEGEGEGGAQAKGAFPGPENAYLGLLFHRRNQPL